MEKSYGPEAQFVKTTAAEAITRLPNFIQAGKISSFRVFLWLHKKTCNHLDAAYKVYEILVV